MTVIITECACYARPKPGVVHSAKSTIQSQLEAPVHPSDDIIHLLHTGLFRRRRVLPCEILADELYNVLDDGLQLAFLNNRNFLLLYHLDGIDLGCPLIQRPQVLIYTGLGREAFIYSFDVVLFFLGVVMQLIKWRQRRDLHRRRFWRAQLGRVGHRCFADFRLTPAPVLACPASASDGPGSAVAIGSSALKGSALTLRACKRWSWIGAASLNFESGNTTPPTPPMAKPARMIVLNPAAIPPTPGSVRIERQFIPAVPRTNAANVALLTVKKWLEIGSDDGAEVGHFCGDVCDLIAMAARSDIGRPDRNGENAPIASVSLQVYSSSFRG